MPLYDLRLYKRRDATTHKHVMTDRRRIEAPSDAEAIEKAKAAPFPGEWDDSNLAMLFSEDGTNLWTISY